ncbi:MAG: nicotinamide riboside transporter PnuC [Cyclobacteriaceae bacterium]|nr:nicotinamide riboside transporter PnuC [Cyclobacteriaceae bacterium]
METMEFFQEVFYYALNMKVLEFLGFAFGVLCVLFLIRQSILTWPLGIAYVLISFVIFIQARLYADFILHIFFLGMNIYGWYYWVYGKKSGQEEVPVTTIGFNTWAALLIISVLGIMAWGYLLNTYTDASLAYWDSTTSVLSFAAMWLTARKKIENWMWWLVVDVLATGIYFYKDLYFYCLLYLFYIGMAIAGYLAWKKTMNQSVVAA